MFGVVEACLDTLHLVIPRSRSDEESAVLQFLVKSRFLDSLENDKGLGFVEAGLDTLLLVIPRSRSDEESAVLQLLVESRFLASLEMTMRGLLGSCPQIRCTHEMSS